MNDTFWQRLDTLVATYSLRIDRPQGTAHPRYPAFVYPLDYGYLAGTQAGDGGGIDVWVGSLAERRVTGALCTVDMAKRDAEVKILLGCTPDEIAQIHRLHNDGDQSAVLIERR